MIKFWNTARGIGAADAWRDACWLQATAPTERETGMLIHQLGIPESFIDDIADADERSRIDTSNGWMMIILRIPHINLATSRAPFVTVPLGILIKDNKVVTVCHHETEMVNDFIARQQRREAGFIDAVDMVFRLFLCAAVCYNKYLRRVSDLIEQAKYNMEGKKIANSDLISLSRLQDTLTYFATSIRGNENLLGKIGARLPVDELDAELIDDVNIETNQARENNWIYINVLNSIIETNANIINNDMSQVMRLLTALNIIIMLPSLIASTFGMNLINGMENWEWGFAVAIAVSVASIAACYLWFRLKNWL